MSSTAHHYDPSDPFPPRSRRAGLREVSPHVGQGMRFVALDFEHCNSSYASVCQLGWIRVDDGEQVKRTSKMIRPASGYDATTKLHLELTGLTRLQIADGHAFADLAPAMAKQMTQMTVVCHNAAADLGMFEQAWWVAGLGPTPELWFLDTMKLAKAEGLPGGLAELHVELFGEEMPGQHHDATDDAHAAAVIAMELCDRLGKEPAELAVRRPAKTTVAVKPPSRRGLVPLPLR